MLINRTRYLVGDTSLVWKTSGVRNGREFDSPSVRQRINTFLKGRTKMEVAVSVALVVVVIGLIVWKMKKSKNESAGSGQGSGSGGAGGNQLDSETDAQMK